LIDIGDERSFGDRLDARRFAIRPELKEAEVFTMGCLLAGHEDMVVHEAGRMWLRCQHCGRDTPGWDIGGDRDDGAGVTAAIVTTSPLGERVDTPSPTALR
jgi:hypothetical protein